MNGFWLYALLAALWLACAGWHMRENRALARELPPHAMTALRARSVQVLLSLLVAAVLAGAMHWKLNNPPQPIAKEQKIIPPAAEAPPATDSEAERQAKLDMLKEKHETLRVNYYYLQRCGLATPDDEAKLELALAREIAALSGPARLSADVITAARGTYDEIYARLGCERAEAEAVAFRGYMEGIAQH